jgi:hypothetical protein
LLQRQLELAWSFADQVVLPQVDHERSLWEPSRNVVSVRNLDDRWVADWPDETQRPLPELTIGWLLWHVEWWWGNARRASRGKQPLPPHEHQWSGSIAGMFQAKARWDDVLATADLDRPVVGLMPTPQPFDFVAAWVNFELTKNLSEMHLLLVRYANAS